MIDAYKIEEATKDYINKNNYFAKYEEETCVDIEFAYKAGAHWAINESLKDLWHPYNEEPRNGSNIVYQNCDRDIHNKQYVKEDYKEGWSDFVCFYSVWKWAYQDDLLPKEGGEQ